MLAATIALGVFVIVGSPAHGAVDPVAACKQKKAKVTGKKAADLLKALGKNEKKPNATKLAADISKAQSKFTKGFTKAESKDGCWTSGDSGTIEAKVDSFVTDAVRSIVPECGETYPACDGTCQLDDVCEDLDGTCGCVARFLDSGDGTITDKQTGLMWEKKDDNNVGGIHDKDNWYLWAGCCDNDCSPPWEDSLCQPNAAAAAVCSMQTGGAAGCSECAVGTCDLQGVTTIWEWLVQVNAAEFAGHSDWRLPEVNRDGGAAELETILLEPHPCETSPCVDPAFNTGCTGGCTVTTCSCTPASYYWSSTPFANHPENARGVFFLNGYVFYDFKYHERHVRAVRGASPSAAFLDATGGVLY
jgi:hypothetical protein